MKNIFKLIILVIIFILLGITYDATKINNNYVNKKTIEFSFDNIKSSKIKNFISFFYNPYKLKNNQIIKVFYPHGIKEDEYIIKSDKNKIISINKVQNEKNFENWSRSHGNNSSNRFSYLNDINKNNISNLKLAWTYTGDISKKHNFDVQANPVFHKGLVFLPDSSGRIVALNGETGKEIWRSKIFSRVVARRGITYYESKKNIDDLLFFSDKNKLISLNANTGKLNKKFGYNGYQRLDGNSSVAPVVYKNSVIVVTFGKSIESYDIKNGNNLWRYSYADPNNGKIINNKRYSNKGGNAWGGISIDNQRGIIFLNTGNPFQYYLGVNRPGINKYSNSVVAFDIEEKKIIWSFQEVFHDVWNLDIPSPPILTSVKYKNKLVDVVVSVTKLGNTLILDRQTGESLFDLNYTKVSPSKIPGEITSSHQLNLKIPEPFSKNKFDLNEVTNISDESRKYVLEQLKTKKLGFFEPPVLDKENLYFNAHGGAEWTGASVDHETQTLYVSANNVPSIASVYLSKNNILKTTVPQRFKDQFGYLANKPPWGTITSINLNKGKINWQIPFGHYPELEKSKIFPSGTENFAGVTGTSGKLLFGGGTLDKKFYAFDTTTGDILWEYNLDYVASSPPTIYKVNGKQYVIVICTGPVQLRMGYPEIVKPGYKVYAFSLQ